MTKAMQTQIPLLVNQLTTFLKKRKEALSKESNKKGYQYICDLQEFINKQDQKQKPSKIEVLSQ